MLLSNILGKKIVNISTALDLGAVTSFTYHDGAIEYFVTDTAMAVKICDILATSDIITCNMHYDYNDLEYALFNISDLLICNIRGKILGNLQDVLVDDSYMVKRLITDERNLAQFRIVSYSSTTLVLDKPEQLTAPVEINMPTVVTNYNFLIDRTLFRDILSPAGKLLFKSGQLITKSDINKARKYGKLVHLTLYSTPIKLIPYDKTHNLLY